VHPEKRKCEQKEQNHEAVGVEENGIFFLIPIVGMSIIFRETRRGLGMAFPACAHDVFLVNGRTGVGDRQDVMRPMTV
jgi:hypothetical protein